MYNINMYEYRDKPFANSREYGIFPLNDKGREKYVSCDSHNSNYLSRVNPKVFKAIVGETYEYMLNESTNTDDRKIISNDPILQNNSNSIPSNNQPALPPPLNQNNEDKENSNEDSKEAKNNSNSAINNHLGHQTNISPQSSLTPSPIPRYKLYKKLFLNRSFKQKFGYEEKIEIDSKKDKYMNMIRNFQKKKLEKNEANLNKTNFLLLPRKYDGFPSYCIPRTDSTKGKRKNSSIIEDIKLKMVRSISFNDQIFENESSFYLMKDKSIKNNLLNQTNKEYLQQSKLPEINKIANTTKVIKKTGNGNCKNMGEKYNPYANVHVHFNRTKRNYTGSLFQH